MEFSRTVWSVLTGVVIIAIIMVLVRPGSTASTAVKDISGALATLVKTAVE